MVTTTISPDQVDVIDLNEGLTKDECSARILKIIPMIFSGTVEELDLANLARYLVMWSHVVKAICKRNKRLAFDRALVSFCDTLGVDDTLTFKVQALETLQRITQETHDTKRFSEDQFRKAALTAIKAIEAELKQTDNHTLRFLTEAN